MKPLLRPSLQGLSYNFIAPYPVVPILPPLLPSGSGAEPPPGPPDWDCGALARDLRCPRRWQHPAFRRLLLVGKLIRPL